MSEKGEQPKIYLFCEATGQGSGKVRGSSAGGDVIGSALAEDGTYLAGHYSSSVGFAKHDLGLTSDWKHDLYKAHYRDGFELVWVDEKDLDSHQGFQSAWTKAQKAAQQR